MNFLLWNENWWAATWSFSSSSTKCALFRQKKSLAPLVSGLRLLLLLLRPVRIYFCPQWSDQSQQHSLLCSLIMPFFAAVVAAAAIGTEPVGLSFLSSCKVKSTAASASAATASSCISAAAAEAVALIHLAFYLICTHSLTPEFY